MIQLIDADLSSSYSQWRHGWYSMNYGSDDLIRSKRDDGQTRNCRHTDHCRTDFGKAGGW